MMMELESFDIELPNVNQISITVEDLYDGFRRFQYLLGIDASRVYRLEGPVHTETIYRGEPAEFSMILGISADITNDGFELWRETRTEIELIQPTDGPSSYVDQLEEHGEGIHHVACWDFEDNEAVVEELTSAGFDVYQRGRVFGGSEYCYIDTRDELCGVLLEVGLGGVQEKQPRPEDHPEIEDIAWDEATGDFRPYEGPYA